MTSDTRPKTLCILRCAVYSLRPAAIYDRKNKIKPDALGTAKVKQHEPECQVK